MKYGEINSFQSGVAIPLSALRTKSNFGIGEFQDLILLGEWAKQCEMEVIQLLPLNDTGSESSPYSARSAFALNPIYLHLPHLTEDKNILRNIEQTALEYQNQDQVHYYNIYNAKVHLLKLIFIQIVNDLRKDKVFLKWIEKNEWVKPYSVYCYLKEINEEKSWTDWKSHSNPNPGRIDALWAKNWKEVVFHAWMQYECEKQFTETAQKLDQMNVRIKGDIPILINEDSADVWAERRFFDLHHRAGAPPDMFSVSGQNWGFPTYKWSILEKNNFSWWRNRLQQASKFYHAFRIDHVLGFFRIWTIPETERTGALGYFDPSIPILRKDLVEQGLPEPTIDFLIQPSTSGNLIREWCGDLAQTAFDQYLIATPGEDRWMLREDLRHESTLFDAVEDGPMRGALLKVLWNRVFLTEKNAKKLYPSWFWYDSAAFSELPTHEQELLQKIIQKNEKSQEKPWAEHATQLLKMMSKETNMLACAEDLGVVPDCVPTVLAKLKILSLKIDRWARDWNQEGAPCIPPENYPRLSVCTSSCHDTSPLRLWWKEEALDRNHWFSLLGFSGEAPLELGSGIAERLILRLLKSESELAILPLQDWLSPFYDVKRTNEEDEKVNTPGTLGDSNWSYRTPFSLEELKDATNISENIQKWTLNRRSRDFSLDVKRS